jgi:hypothetical protein
MPSNSFVSAMMIEGRRYGPIVGMTPSRSRCGRPVLAARVKASSRSIDCRISTARARKSSPKGVSRTLRAARSTSGAPTVSSSSRICMDSAGCEIAHAAEAFPKCFRRASASK